jgi:sec-independent protein translocase protein TatB
MFDISVGELALIGAVALVVIGPEKLPKVARTVGVLLGRAQRYVANVKADINREIELENLRKLEAEMNEAGRKLGQELRHSLEGLQSPQQEALATTTVTATASSDVPAISPSASPSPDGQFDLFHPPERPAPERDRR